MTDERPSLDETALTPWLQGRSFADWRTQYDEAGYVIFENVLNPREVAAIREALAPHLKRDISGRNDFEGLQSNRIYALLAKSPVFADMVAHPLALAFAEADLGPTCLLSACLAINLHPGETVQPWHTDDGHIPLPSPHPPFGVSTFWAIDDTTEDNGATEVLPGSHTWPTADVDVALSPGAFRDRKIRDVNDDPAPRADAIRACMPSGSLMVTKSALWHRGGANRSRTPRLIVTPQYCAGWARQLENMMAAISKDVAATLPERVRELVGYSIHPPFMGYVDGVHPRKTLERP
ncbi:phytanoyl-CoA dioxygenase family protein [Eilatimonas milleporae]|uniref:Ectoine hydroxylase-related dioxygenase (Phytanoyl-CoA dioxygenase family) n=1 Tax=Eilatimonas milleporae TaxID=911205 RepID=A0A3M0CIG7_9PROT|nr:phytanoyl-CoA dioxygenase family protein [Eilatimonas milleporae]RMB08625.1 ectoine hydroxylase-related dioxygenase (phytanoyl-CoA dioxygenase family) [Eilatimonas milleporae]